MSEAPKFFFFFSSYIEALTHSLAHSLVTSLALSFALPAPPALLLTAPYCSSLLRTLRQVERHDNSERVVKCSTKRYVKESGRTKHRNQSLKDMTGVVRRELGVVEPYDADNPDHAQSQPFPLLRHLRNAPSLKTTNDEDFTTAMQYGLSTNEQLVRVPLLPLLLPPKLSLTPLLPPPSSLSTPTNSRVAPSCGVRST